MNKLNGYKTYLIGIIGVIYGWGIAHNLWPHEPTIDYLLAGGAVAAMRHGLKTEAAKIISAALTDPPALPPAPVMAPSATATGTAQATAANSQAPGAAGKTILPMLLAGGLAFGLVCGLTACKGTLESGGAYAPLVTNTVAGTNAVTAQPDMAFYIADAAYQVAWKGVNAAFDFEFNNAATLWKVSPQIKKGLDAIRPGAVKANADYLTARAVYIANPIPDNLSAVQLAMAEIQRLATAAVALLPTGTPIP